jgi:hypothetical protein
MSLGMSSASRAWNCSSVPSFSETWSATASVAGQVLPFGLEARRLGLLDAVELLQGLRDRSRGRGS